MSFSSICRSETFAYRWWLTLSSLLVVIVQLYRFRMLRKYWVSKMRHIALRFLKIWSSFLLTKMKLKSTARPALQSYPSSSPLLRPDQEKRYKNIELIPIGHLRRRMMIMKSENDMKASNFLNSNFRQGFMQNDLYNKWVYIWRGAVVYEIFSTGCNIITVELSTSKTVIRMFMWMWKILLEMIILQLIVLCC